MKKTRTLTHFVPNVTSGRKERRLWLAAWSTTTSRLS